MQSLDQQLDSLNVATHQGTVEPVDQAGSDLRGKETAQASLEPSKEWTQQKGRRWLQRRIAIGLGLALSAGVTSAVAIVHYRYSDRTLDSIPLMTETIENHTWQGNDISFEQQDGNIFDVSFTLSSSGADSGGTDSGGADGADAKGAVNSETETQLRLRDIDLTLFMPKVPATARNNKDLTQWFLTEREFNRQRVIFEPGSTHIDLPTGLAGYRAEEISISLTNNCLGAGYWEIAVSALNEEGNSEKIYQGYFTFPRGVYAEIVSWLNPSHYWQQARTMEAWPGFRFLSGLPFALDELRQVDTETVVQVSDLKTENIIAADEQIDKETLIVRPDADSNRRIQTWEDLRQSDLKFQSFVSPGIYDETRLWASDFSQLSTVVGATGRQITSALSDDSLVEVEIDFENDAGELRKLVVSGIDWDQMPRLDSAEYSDGIYMPLGFGTAFTQSYAELEANRPESSPFFSVILDEEDRVIDYRKDIGLNGLVMHRDADNPRLLHLYPMSYERITLVGHYVINLNLYQLSEDLS
ncbi:MAG: hypothetical protein ACFB16_15510 [Phormidesmis sp.]